MIDILAYTIPDAPIIDAIRGFVAVACFVLFFLCPFAWRWGLRNHVSTRTRGLMFIIFGTDIYIGATEAQQIGHRMIVWRLPLGFAIVLGALLYLIRLLLAVHEDKRAGVPNHGM